MIDLGGDSDEPPGVAQLTLLQDHRMEVRHFGVLEAALSLDDDPLALLDDDALGIAERGFPVLVVVDPDSNVETARIQPVSDPATATAATGHREPPIKLSAIWS